MAKGTTGIGKSLHDLNVFLFEKNKKVMYVVALILIPSLTFLVFNWEAKDKAGEMLGSEEIRIIIAKFGGSGGGSLDFGDTKDFEQMRRIENYGDYVNERGHYDITLSSNATNVVEHLMITITWEDETEKPGRPTVRRYSNQPDTFVATLVWPNGNNTAFEEDDNGRIAGDVKFTQEEMKSMYGLGDFKLRVTCTEAGDWEPILKNINIIKVPDNGNDVTVKIEEVYWAPPLSEK